MKLNISEILSKKIPRKLFFNWFSDLELGNLFFPFKIIKIARTAVRISCSLGETTELVSKYYITV